MEMLDGRIRAASFCAAAMFMLVAGVRPAAAQDTIPAQPPEVEADLQVGGGLVTVASIDVEGNRRDSETAVERQAGLRPGTEVNYRDIQQAIRRLWESGQYSDVEIFAEDAPGGSGVDLLIRVEEHPFIAEIEFEGLENVAASTIRDTAGLEPRTPLNPGRVAMAEYTTRTLLAEKGFRVRDIEHRLEEVPGYPGEYRLIFDVTEGQRIAISEIEFEGNEVYSADRLRGVLDTKPEGFFWFRRGTFDEDQIRADLRGSLPSFYESNGYIDFAVEGDTLLVDEETGKGRLVIRVDEGPRYRLAEFSVEGNRRFSEEQLRGFFAAERQGLLAGLGLRRSEEDASAADIFDHVAFQRAADQVRQLYRNEGYLYSRIEPVVERTTTDSGEPAVLASWQIIEGDPAYVNRVDIVGNTYTHEQVIRRHLRVVPGDVYNEDALVRTMESIMATGFFETPLSPPRFEETEDGDVDITFEVAEQQTGSLNFGTSMGGYSRLAGFLGYDQPNLFGQAKSGHLRWEFGRYSNNLEARYSDPAIQGSRFSGSLSFYNTRNRYYSFSEGQYRRLGGSLLFGMPFPWDDFSRIRLGYSLVRTSYEESQGQASSVFSLPPGMQSSATLGLTRSTTNHPLFPTSGTSQEITAEFSGGPLGGDGDFQKYTTSGQWYVPVGQIGGGQPGSTPVRFTLGLGIEGGALFGDASRFPFDRFWMGGVQFGRPLRGYVENTITPAGYFPRSSNSLLLEDRFGDAYLRLSAEYAIRVNDNISVSAFGDAGNLWRRPSEVNPTSLFRGAGVGITLVTPFGPLGLDYAYGFDRTIPGWELHFKMGGGL